MTDAEVDDILDLNTTESCYCKRDRHVCVRYEGQEIPELWSYVGDYDYINMQDEESLAFIKAQGYEVRKSPVLRFRFP